MEHTKGKWKVDRSGIASINIKSGDVFVAGIHNQDKRIEGMEVWESNAYDTSETDANANLIALAPEMLELLKDILAEVRPEISRVNEVAGHTIFNPVATETIDMAKELIDKAEREDK